MPLYMTIQDLIILHNPLFVFVYVRTKVPIAVRKHAR